MPLFSLGTRGEGAEVTIEEDEVCQEKGGRGACQEKEGGGDRYLIFEQPTSTTAQSCNHQIINCCPIKIASL